MARKRTLWMAYLEPHPHLIVALWRLHIVELPADFIPTERYILERRGCKVVVGGTIGSAIGKVDDLRERCSLCEDGQGAHRCDSCQSAILTGQLDLSVRRVA